MTSDHLYLFDTKTKQKHPLKPSKEKVSLYVCGPTVYDRAHLGNARSVVVFDVLFRVLQKKFSSVVYVRNFTDIDDKIIVQMQKTGEDIKQFTKKYIDYFHHDMDLLGNLRPTHEPRATHYIKQMIQLITLLIQQEKAYVHEGQVMFHVKHWQDYGSLSKKTANFQKQERIQKDDKKQNELDFVLWKPSKSGEPFWESPWGKGRPGWHIECSAMSHAFFDLPFDIHGGGQDLIFPHHENEQAQSCAAFQKKELACFWVHNGILLREGQKMAKSLGNSLTVEDALAHWPKFVVRWVLLSALYRHPLDWRREKLEESYVHLKRLSRLFPSPEESLVYKKNKIPPKDSEIYAILLNDLNTPNALSKLIECAKKIEKKPENVEKIKGDIWFGLHVLGLEDLFIDYLQSQKEKSEDLNIEQAIQERLAAKKQKNFQEADRIREHLYQQGIVLEDSAQGTKWRRL